MSLIMANSGHQIVAEALFDEKFYMSWGILDSQYQLNHSWGQESDPPLFVVKESVANITKMVDTVITTEILSFDFYKSFEELSDSTNTKTFVEGTDFRINTDNTYVTLEWISSNIPEDGETIEFKHYLKDFLSDQTSLLRPIVFRVNTSKGYVLPDPEGVIEANGQLWSPSGTPTRHIHLQFRFAGTDASNNVIYQIGVFMNTVPKAEFINKQVLTIDEIDGEGTLFMVSNVKPFSRNPATREIYDIVLTM